MLSIGRITMLSTLARRLLSHPATKVCSDEILLRVGYPLDPSALKSFCCPGSFVRTCLWIVLVISVVPLQSMAVRLGVMRKDLLLCNRTDHARNATMLVRHSHAAESDP